MTVGAFCSDLSFGSTRDDEEEKNDFYPHKESFFSVVVGAAV